MAAACDLVTGCDNIRFFYAERGGTDARVGVLAVVPHSNNFSAVSRGANAVGRGSLISGGGRHHNAHIL